MSIWNSIPLSVASEPAQMADQLGIHELLARLLVRRGITTYEQARLFFRPHFGVLHDPFLMKDMDKAVARVETAIAMGQKIQVYGDYDVDGTTAVAILSEYLQSRGVDVFPYIPQRFKEGYGINEEGIKTASQQGVQLIISVDCGITAIDEAVLIREKGMELIICDHHTVGDKLPDAVAILDPKRPDCPYPFKGLSGAAVALKLIQALLIKDYNKRGISLSEGDVMTLLDPYLDLTAISIASDIVPMEDENRLLTSAGLRNINERPRTGLAELMKHVRCTPGTLTSGTVVFSLGPRINAAGRMGDAITALDLLLAKTSQEANEIVVKLEQINIERKEVDRVMFEEAQKIVFEGQDEHEHIIILQNEKWHQGVIGIVASRLVDLFHRPTILLTSDGNGYLKGSGRSVKGFNIYTALQQAGDVLQQFGGHEFAGGMTLRHDRYEEFRHRMREYASQMMSQADLKPRLEYEEEIDLREVDQKFWKILSQFEPFGPGNERPVFVSRGVMLSGAPFVVGQGHLKLKIQQNGSGTFEAIGYRMHEFLPQLTRFGSRGFDIAYQIEENHFRGKRTLQLNLLDIQV